MRSKLSFIFSFCFVAALVVAMPAFADTASAPDPAMGFLTPVVTFLMGMPKVGPILATVFSIVALIAGVMTYLSIFVQAVLAMPELVARWAGAHALGDKVKAISDKILPWLKYFSMFNVQKVDPASIPSAPSSTSNPSA